MLGSKFNEFILPCCPFGIGIESLFQFQLANGFVLIRSEQNYSIWSYIFGLIDDPVILFGSNFNSLRSDSALENDPECIILLLPLFYCIFFFFHTSVILVPNFTLLSKAKASCEFRRTVNTLSNKFVIFFVDSSMTSIGLTSSRHQHFLFVTFHDAFQYCFGSL